MKIGRQTPPDDPDAKAVKSPRQSFGEGKSRAGETRTFLEIKRNAAMSLTRRASMLAHAGLVAGGAYLLTVMLTGSHAQEYEVGALKVEHPWLRAPGEGENVATLYMVVHNTGDAQDKLVGVKSDKIGAAVLHADVKRIVVPHGIVIPPHATVLLEPDRPYVSLEGVEKMNPVGGGFAVRLVFEKAGEVAVDASVEAPDARHAHDAEATARWEKAHGGGAPATPAQEGRQEATDAGKTEPASATPAAAPAADGK